MKRLLLVDGHSLIHRAYHAYPQILTTRSGELTNAVYGFTNILLTTISELEPTHVAVAFDLPKQTFREALFVGYKQSRVKPDDEMIIQIPRIKEVVQALNIPIFEVAGYEADDVIGTLCREATEGKVKRLKGQKVSKNQEEFSNLLTFQPSSLTCVVILTSDRDLMQLIVDDMIVIKMPVRGKSHNQKRPGLFQKGRAFPDDIWNEDRFISEWGFKPELLPDYKAFAGDQSDDIPGVKGIGEKTAKELVSKFGNVDDAYREILKGLTLQGQTLIRKLAEGQDSAQLSKKLATIDVNVPIKLDWKATEVHEYDKEKVLKLFDDLQFKSLIPKLPNDTFEQNIQEILF